LKHGFITFFKLWPDTKYDMVIDCEGQLFRAQVKGSSTGTIAFTTVQRGGEAEEHRRPVHHYDRSDCDLIIGVDAGTGDCYIIPIDYAIATGRQSGSFRDLQNFRERWDFISGNNYLTVEECRNGVSHAELRNKVQEMRRTLTPPADVNELRIVFYENCPGLTPEEPTS